MTRIVWGDFTVTNTHAGGVEEHLEEYVRDFNSGDFAAVDRHYTEDSISVWDPKTALTGAARRDSLAEFLRLGPKLTSRIRESHVTGDTALLAVDWTMEVTDADGVTEHLAGIGADVLARGTDGKWRFAVDSPYGDPRNRTE